MIYRFRHGVIGPLGILWLTVRTVAYKCLVMGTVAWRPYFSSTLDASDPG